MSKHEIVNEINDYEYLLKTVEVLKIHIHFLLKMR